MHENIKLILGTMTFGEQIFGNDVKDMITCFLKQGYKELDTAYVYNNGECERLLGNALRQIDRGDYESNFPAWLVGEAYNICDKHGWMLPKVYEGLYNPLGRYAERELNTALDYYGMCFYAYNPLAGGMLTNKYSSDDRILKAGRFTNRPNYQQRYWKDSYFKASDHIKKACSKYDISIIEATYRWLANHSMLNPERGDAIIVGASRLSQLEQNMKTLSQGELPGEIINAIEEAWEICRVDAPEYFKYYVPK